MSFTATPEIEADIQALSAALEACPIGETVSYAALSEAIGRDVRNCRHVLAAARRQAEENTGHLFQTIRTVGVKRLTAEEIPAVGLGVMRHVRRSARAGMNRLAAVRVNDMPEGEARKIIAHRSMLGAIALVADGRKATSLLPDIEKTAQTVPAGRVLELFRK